MSCYCQLNVSSLPYNRHKIASNETCSFLFLFVLSCLLGFFIEFLFVVVFAAFQLLLNLLKSAHPNNPKLAHSERLLMES